VSRPDTFLESLACRIERLGVLDGAAESLAGLLSRAVPAGAVRDVASGTPLGHPAHPMLVAVPIGSFLGAGYLDVVSPRKGRAAARRLIGFGLATAVPSVYAGVSDWMDTDGAERRVGLVHAALNAAALSLYGASWLARGRGRRGVGLAVAGAGLLGAGGWLGGHLAYALGVGVDTTVFQRFPDEWTDVAAADDLQPGRPVRVDVDDVPILLLRTGHGLVALADRCSHRGGPLDEGDVDGDCITCPWHGSRFDVRDGSVRGGPATRPQPALEIRERDGRIEIQRPDEQRSLRTNPA
jgi:nitrite reductase/ring-hydroxylating ferredoxin subunit/uncharacterized membrane protein